jgi:hypothetical protein
MDISDGQMSRAVTVDASLNEAEVDPQPGQVMQEWSLRPPAANDQLLRHRFNSVLAESQQLPAEERLIMYDACDDLEVRAPLGHIFRKRLDARRNTKPKKSDDQLLVCTPFNQNGFHFGKIKNDRERLLKLALRTGRYDVLTNKFPLFPKHMLLVADALVPQQMTSSHLAAISELLSASTFCAYFNSWCASASVNHFHCHLIDEFPPVTQYPLVNGPTVAGVRCLQPQGFPGFCFAFPTSALDTVECCIKAMQEDNQPHNLLFTPRHIYVFPKPHVRPARSFELYPETVGGPELIGSWTVYTDDVYASLKSEHADELCRINTAPLPSRLLQRNKRFHDDGAAFDAATTERASVRAAIAPSLTVDFLPRYPTAQALHDQDWPEDRPLARALSVNHFMCV